MAITKRISTKYGKIYIYGAGTIIALIGLLLSLDYLGISITTSGDITCAGNKLEPCVSYINISNNGAFNISFSSKLAVIYFDNESLVNYTLYKRDTLGRWRSFNITGKTLKQNEIWQLKLIGYKPIDKTVKWGVKSNLNEVDPVWKGYSADDFFISLDKNYADLTYGEAIFKVKNPTSFNFTVDAINNKFGAEFTKYLGNDIDSWNLDVLANRSYSENITNYSTVCNPYYDINSTLIDNCTQIPSGWYWNNYTREEWRDIKLSDVFVSGKTYTIKLTAIWDAHVGQQSIEWFPQITIQNTTLIQYKYAWWNTSWSRRTPINISTSSGATQTGYQIDLNITYDSDMQPDFDDLRFVNETDNGELPFYINSKVDSSYANITVKIDTATNTTNKTIYMYYGYASATFNNTDGGFNTFNYFDNYNRADSTTLGNNWTKIGGITANISNNQLLVSTSSGGYLKHVFKNITLDMNNYSVSLMVKSPPSFGTDYPEYFYGLLNATPASGGLWGFDFRHNARVCLLISGSGWTNCPLSNIPANTWYTFTWEYNSTSKTMTMYYSNSTVPKTVLASNVQGWSDSNWNPYNNSISISNEYTGATNEYVENLTVRKVFLNGINYYIGSEETSTQPTYSLNSTNSTLAGTPVSHNLKWTDNTGLSGYIFSFDNCTGTLVNNSFVSFSGTTNWSNVTKTINSTVGCTIQWKVYANDTSNNWNTSLTYSYITTSAGAPDLNFTFGPPNTNLFRFIGCGPAITNSSALPENQTSSYGIHYLCNNGTQSGNMQIKYTGTLNTGWTLKVSNTTYASANWITLTNSWQTIVNNMATNTCNYMWHNATCNNVVANPGVSIDYQIV